MREQINKVMGASYLDIEDKAKVFLPHLKKNRSKI
jgi:hypothetical protein